MRKLQISVVAIALAGVLACGRGEESAPPALSEAELQRLEALGYVDWAEEPVEDAHTGVVAWDPERAHPGYNLVTLPTLRRAELVDMAGDVLQSWTGDEATRWDGSLRWSRELPVHHHVVERPDGSLAILTRRQRWLPDLTKQTRLVDNGVAILSPDGELLEERSIHDVLSSRPDLFGFLPIESGPDEPNPDFLHANFIHWMRRPALARHHSLYALSNVLITLRKQDAIAVFDFEKGDLVWAWGQGDLLRPHDAKVLGNGNILIFDNRTGKGMSRVVELDPIALEIVWEWPGAGELEFYSKTRGTVQRFPNGNTLIGESNRGRAIEVTAEAEVVWEYWTPHRNEKSQPAAFRIERYPASQIPLE